MITQLFELTMPTPKDMLICLGNSYMVPSIVVTKNCWEKELCFHIDIGHSKIGYQTPNSQS